MYVYRIKVITINILDKKYIPQKYRNEEWQDLNKKFNTEEEARKYIEKLKSVDVKISYIYV